MSYIPQIYPQQPQGYPQQQPPQNNSTNKPLSNQTKVIIGVLVLVTLVAIYLLFFYKSNTTSSLPDTPDTSDTSVPPVESIPPEKQVFHVPGYNYTASEAPGVCKSRGATVATMDQLKEDWTENNASWCSWGWTADDQGLINTPSFPTYLDDHKQYMIMGCSSHGIQEMWPNVPKNERNLTAKYGVNCYGELPENKTDLLYGVAFPHKNSDDPVSIIPNKKLVNPNSRGVITQDMTRDESLWKCREIMVNDPSMVGMMVTDTGCTMYPIQGSTLVDSPGSTSYVKYRYLSNFSNL